MENNKAYPLVSILMVVYNSSEFLQEAIDSVLACDYPNLELILCDDCSTDDSVKIIESYSDQRIRFFKNNSNLGEYANRNKCMNLALGDYFLFVDGDDTLLRHGLESAVFAMNKYPNSPLGLYVGDQYLNSEVEIITPKETFRHVYFGRNILHQSFAGNLFRTQEIRTKFGEFPTNLYSADYYIRASLAMTNDIVVLHEPFAKWRKRPGQASDRMKKKLSGILEPYLLQIYFLYHADNPLSLQELKEAKRKIINKQLTHFFVSFKKTNFKNAFEILKTCFLHLKKDKAVEIKKLKK